MKKIIFLIIIFFTFCSFLFSQTRLDSLQTQLEKATGLEKVDILNELAQDYLNASPQKAIEYSNQALKLSQEINHIEGEAQALKNIGVGHYYLSNFDKSLEFYFKSLKIMEDIDDKVGISDLLNNIGVVYWRLTNFEKALELYKSIFEEGDICPVCGSDDITEKFGGRIYIIDPEKSEIGKLIKAKVKGVYAVRVK